MATTSDNPADHGRFRFWDERTGANFRYGSSLERGDCYEVIAGKNGRPLLIRLSNRRDAWQPSPGSKPGTCKQATDWLTPYPLAGQDRPPGTGA